MKILVLSDTHHHEIAKELLEDADLIIHCGDFGKSKELLDKYNVFYVRGNCDCDGQKYQLITFNNKKIFITHGDLENVKYGYDRLIYRALETEADICCFGHTHHQEMFKAEGITFLNPGAYPKYAIICDDEIILKDRW